VKSDKLEAVITLASGVFFGTGVSACILVMNNNKSDEHKGKVLLIDASQIYTAQIAQNIMTGEDIQEVFDLYLGYEDVIDRAKVVTIDEIATKEYSLTVNNYIERTVAEVVDPSVIRKEYMDAVKAVISAENHLKELLIKEGLLNE
jgi:type I restriction enzyme M protein